MKSLLVAALVLGSISAFSASDNKDIDITDIWVSWCENNQVMKSSEQHKIVKLDCAAAQKLCVEDQATRKHYVYYTAQCEDKPEKVNRSEVGSQ